MSLGVRERMARKPVLRSACRVSSVTARRRGENLQNNICKHYTKPTRRISALDFSHVVKI